MDADCDAMSQPIDAPSIAISFVEAHQTVHTGHRSKGRIDGTRQLNLAFAARGDFHQRSQ